MNTHFKLRTIAWAIAAACLSFVPLQAQETSAKQVEQTLRHYFASMSARDLEGLRSALDDRFMVIKATPENARSYVVDAADPKSLLPRNDDWDQIKVAEVRVELSATHPTVASVAFGLTRPLEAREADGMEAALKDAPAAFDGTQKKAIARMLADRVVTGSGFALLARREGKWKIVSLTIPKM